MKDLTNDQAKSASIDELPVIEVDYMEAPEGLEVGAFADMDHHDKQLWVAWCDTHDWSGDGVTILIDELMITTTPHLTASCTFFQTTDDLLAWAGY